MQAKFFALADVSLKLAILLIGAFIEKELLNVDALGTFFIVRELHVMILSKSVVNVFEVYKQQAPPAW